MSNFVYIIPRTPKHFRNSLREHLWQRTKQSLHAQKYQNWKALVIDEYENQEDKITYVKSTALKKGEKLQHALKIIESWNTKPDFIIRLDDDDIILPTTLEILKDKDFDVAIDKYHTFYEIKSGLFCQSHRPWYANTVIHKYQHAKTLMPDGRPLLDQDHSMVWHRFYTGKKVFSFSKKNPIYVRILSPSTVTSNIDIDYLKYVRAFGFWQDNKNLQKQLGPVLPQTPKDTLFNIKIRFNYPFVFSLLKQRTI